MNRQFLLLGFTMTAAACSAQQKEGRVTYQCVQQFKLQVSGSPELMEAMPKSRTTNFELNFANGQVSWKAVEEDLPDDEVSKGGLTIRFAGGGADDVGFYEPDKLRRVEQHEFAGRKFLVTDSIKKLNWKMGTETKTILGHLCHKATTESERKRMTTAMNNGQLERVETVDTIQTIAWFTTDIPVAAGPVMQGQLPGLILELEQEKGMLLYQATEIRARPDFSALKEPTKGKKMNQAQYDIERKKLMEELDAPIPDGRGIRLQVSQ